MGKLIVGNVIEVHGFVMLAKLSPGRYRVKSDGTYYGIPYYDFSLPRGNKTVVRHYQDSVDAWIRDRNNEDLNKIVILDK